MKVSELITKLQSMPQDAEVWYHWDGALRSIVGAIWLTRDDRVGLGSLFTDLFGCNPVYDLEDRTSDTAHDTNRYLNLHDMLGITPPIEEEDN